MAVDDNGYETEDETGDKPQWRKELEQQARAGREALARAEAAEPPMGQPEENDQAVSALTNLSPWGPDGQLDPHGKDKIAEEFIRMGGSLSNEKPGDWVQIGSTPVPGNPGR
jgi:hypothetical protein